LSKPLLDHWLPRHQREARSIVKHRLAPAEKHDGTSVNADHALPVGHGTVLQTSFSGNIPRGSRQFAPTQLSQSLFG
jgi:hypothetical protein